MLALGDADLSALRTVLGELGAEVTITRDLLAGGQLATVPLDRFDYAVAVLPGPGPGSEPRSARLAIYFTAGLLQGRGLPLFVIAEDSADEFRSISGRAPDLEGTYDTDTLRLHLSLFAEVAPLKKRLTITWTPLSEPGTRRERVFDKAVRGFQLEQEVFDRLRESGSLVVERERLTDIGADAAMVIPGTEQSLGTVLVMVKSTADLRHLQDATRKLSTAVSVRRASLGILIYGGEPNRTTQEHLASRLLMDDVPVVPMSIDRFRRENDTGSLGRTLIAHRNAFVHGRHGGS